MHNKSLTKTVACALASCICASVGMATHQLGRPVPVNLAHATVQLLLHRSILRRSRCKGIARTSLLAVNQNRLRHAVQMCSISGLTTGFLASGLTIGGATGFEVEFSDPLRPDARETIAGLSVLGISSTIISGDCSVAVAPIARALGLIAQIAMMPQDKLDAIARQSTQNHKVLMIGNGLNVGPALPAGYASMAPASASDARQNAADIVFMRDSLSPIAIAIRAARKT
jgi:P-type E1-E2 ATPase